MKKLLITIFGIILLVGIVVSFVQINHSIDLDKKEKDILTSIGINEPIISSCIKIDEFNCKANVFQKGGINKDMEIVIKYCEEYEINYSNGDCLNYSYTTEQNCINWTENQTICLEYETVQVQGECLVYEIIETTTNNCLKWKILNQVEIETEMKKEVEALLKSIASVQTNRNSVKEVLTDEIKIEIKEKVGEIPKGI